MRKTNTSILVAVWGLAHERRKIYVRDGMAAGWEKQQSRNDIHMGNESLTSKGRQNAVHVTQALMSSNETSLYRNVRWMMANAN